MMTARQYADKYPGQVVRLSAKFAKELGLKNEQPLGKIVGFKPGKKGVIGSSKVAIHLGGLSKQKGLDEYYKFKSEFHSVVPNPPDYRLGIYYLSVDWIELVAPPKPVTAYPHSCNVCGSPARKAASISVCSKVGCKANKAVLASCGPIPKLYTLDKDGFLLCPTCQIKDNVKSTDFDFVPSSSYANNYKNLTCRAKNHNFTHTWKDGQKLIHQGRKFIWKNNSLAEWVAPKKQAVIKKKGASIWASHNS